ncbi:unnamed protein product, partial [Rotaria magnacalcarata]
MANDKATPVLPNERKRKNQNISSLEPTNTDWKSQIMSVTNTALFTRLQELGCNPPEINDTNRMYALALIYDEDMEHRNNYDISITTDEISDFKENQSFDHRRGNNQFIASLTKPYYVVLSPYVACQTDWNQSTFNTRELTRTRDISNNIFPLQDHAISRRYAVTYWAGDQDDIMAEFKRLQLNHTPHEDERIIDVQYILDILIET